MKNKKATVPKKPGKAAKLDTGSAPNCRGLPNATAIVTPMPINTEAVPTAEITATPLISRNHERPMIRGPTRVSIAAVVGVPTYPNVGATTLSVSAIKMR